MRQDRYNKIFRQELYRKEMCRTFPWDPYEQGLKRSQDTIPLKIYYVVWRFFNNGPGNVRQWMREVKYFCQRGYRGYSDRDVWSVDWFLAQILPKMLLQLKNTKHGTPMQCFPDGPEYIDEHGSPNDLAT